MCMGADDQAEQYDGLFAEESERNRVVRITRRAKTLDQINPVWNNTWKLSIILRVRHRAGVNRIASLAPMPLLGLVYQLSDHKRQPQDTTYYLFLRGPGAAFFDFNLMTLS